jgi:hypothetical protein
MISGLTPLLVGEGKVEGEFVKNNIIQEMY